MSRQGKCSREMTSIFSAQMIPLAAIRLVRFGNRNPYMTRATTTDHYTVVPAPLTQCEGAEKISGRLENCHSTVGQHPPHPVHKKTQNPSISTWLNQSQHNTNIVCSLRTCVLLRTEDGGPRKGAEP